MRILFFAGVRDATRCDAVEWPDAGAVSVEELWVWLLARFPRLEAQRSVVRLARNGFFVDEAAVLESGDEVALIPPVSGG